MCRFTPRATAIARGNKPTHFHNLRTLQVIPSGEKPLWKCVVCYLWWQIDSSLFPVHFSICVRCFIYGTVICSIVVSTSAQAENIMKRMTEEEWMTGLRRERRRPGYEIYQQPITAERKHTVQIHHGVAGVSVLLRFFWCVSTPLKPPGVRHCNIASGGLSISIPLRFSYWKLTCHEFQRVERVLRGWLGGTQFFQCSVFCHPTPLKLPLKMRRANMKQRHFSPNQSIWPGSKSVQVKEVMLENA